MSGQKILETLTPNQKRCVRLQKLLNDKKFNGLAKEYGEKLRLHLADFEFLEDPNKNSTKTDEGIEKLLEEYLVKLEKYHEYNQSYWSYVSSSYKDIATDLKDLEKKATEAMEAVHKHFVANLDTKIDEIVKNQQSQRFDSLEIRSLEEFLSSLKKTEGKQEASELIESKGKGKEEASELIESKGKGKEEVVSNVGNQGKESSEKEYVMGRFKLMMQKALVKANIETIIEAGKLINAEELSSFDSLLKLSTYTQENKDGVKVPIVSPFIELQRHLEFKEQIFSDKSSLSYMLTRFDKEKGKIKTQQAEEVFATLERIAKTENKNSKSFAQSFNFADIRLAIADKIGRSTMSALSRASNFADSKFETFEFVRHTPKEYLLMTTVCALIRGIKNKDNLKEFTKAYSKIFTAKEAQIREKFSSFEEKVSKMSKKEWDQFESSFLNPNLAEDFYKSFEDHVAAVIESALSNINERVAMHNNGGNIQKGEEWPNVTKADLGNPASIATTQIDFGSEAMQFREPKNIRFSSGVIGNNVSVAFSNKNSYYDPSQDPRCQDSLNAVSGKSLTKEQFDDFAAVSKKITRPHIMSTSGTTYLQVEFDKKTGKLLIKNSGDSIAMLVLQDKKTGKYHTMPVTKPNTVDNNMDEICTIFADTNNDNPLVDYNRVSHDPFMLYHERGKEYIPNAFSVSCSLGDHNVSNGQIFSLSNKIDSYEYDLKTLEKEFNLVQLVTCSDGVYAQQHFGPYIFNSLAASGLLNSPNPAETVVSLLVTVKKLSSNRNLFIYSMDDSSLAVAGLSESFSIILNDGHGQLWASRLLAIAHEEMLETGDTKDIVAFVENCHSKYEIPTSQERAKNNREVFKGFCKEIDVRYEAMLAKKNVVPVTAKDMVNNNAKKQEEQTNQGTGPSKKLKPLSAETGNNNSMEQQ